MTHPLHTQQENITSYQEVKQINEIDAALLIIRNSPLAVSQT